MDSLIGSNDNFRKAEDL